MVTVTDPDLLVDPTDIVVDTDAKTIQILTGSAVDNAGATGGVTGQALYSFLKEEWKTNSTYIRFPFPMEAITPEQFEFINGWAPADDSTRKLIRTAGWAERSLAGVIERQYTGIVSLGNLDIDDQPYSRFGNLGDFDFTYPGPINEALQIFGDASNGNFDYSAGTALTLFCREQGKTYSTSNNTAIGATTLTYITYRFPLTNAVDLNITQTDAIIATGAPYTTITIEYFGTDQLYDVDDEGINEAYRYIITDGLGTSTTAQIYEKIQYELRQATDIDNGGGTVTGRVADSLLNFVGSTLVGEDGVFITGLNSNFLNSVDFYDFTGIVRRYPFVSAGNINFGAFAGSGDFRWWAFYDSVPAGDYGTSTGVIVQDSNGVALSGIFEGVARSFDYAYDSNIQGGRTQGTDADVTLVGIGLTGGQFASVGFTITRSQGISVLLAPAQERNYTNPA